MANLTPNAKQQFFTASGDPLVGGKLYSYEAGTTTPLATYTDSTASATNANPTILNARGEAGVWLANAAYKFKLTDANDVEIWTVDNISASASAVSPALSGNVTITTTSGSPALTITQLGTGAAFLVEDQTSPDLSPFIITATGNVGVGTLTPTQKLDITGYVNITDGASNAMTFSTSAGVSEIASSGPRRFQILADGTNRFSILGTNGYVGIGTDNPQYKLDVQGDIRTLTNIIAASNISATTMTATSTITANSALISDIISERTSGSGVTVAGVLCKNSLVAASARPIESSVAVATTSGTSISFGSNPSWVKRATIIFDNVVCSASILLKIGPSSGVVSAGYSGASGYTPNSSATVVSGNSTSILIPVDTNAAYGTVSISALGSSNIYVISGCGGGGTTRTWVVGGRVALSGALSIAELSGGTFSAGSANIFYE